MDVFLQILIKDVIRPFYKLYIIYADYSVENIVFWHFYKIFINMQKSYESLSPNNLFNEIYSSTIVPLFQKIYGYFRAAQYQYSHKILLVLGSIKINPGRLDDAVPSLQTIYEGACQNFRNRFMKLSKQNYITGSGNLHWSFKFK